LIWMTRTNRRRAESPIAGASEPPTEPGNQAAEPVFNPRRKQETRVRIRQKGEPTTADLAALEQTNWEEIKTAWKRAARLNSNGPGQPRRDRGIRRVAPAVDFLRTQCDDLTNARAELLKAIDEINQASQKQFAVTFEQVRKNFEYTFQTLFGGGHARLELIQAGDILEAASRSSPSTRTGLRAFRCSPAARRR